MAVAGDFVYLDHVIDRGEIVGPVLDLGSRNVQGGPWGNARHICEKHGIQWEGADLQMGPDVTFTLDVLDPNAIAEVGRTWPTVIATNLFEHVYDPIRALESTLRLVAEGGTCAVITPAVWDIHDYPRDYWRALPDFYLEFGERNGCEVREPRWIVGDQIIPWDELGSGPQKHAPSKHHEARVFGRGKSMRSRIVHRLFQTTGRHMFFPYSGIGVCLRRCT